MSCWCWEKSEELEKLGGSGAVWQPEEPSCEVLGFALAGAGHWAVRSRTPVPGAVTKSSLSWFQTLPPCPEPQGYRGCRSYRCLPGLEGVSAGRGHGYPRIF